MPASPESLHIRPTTKLYLVFFLTLAFSYHLLLRQRMGVKDLMGKFTGSKGESSQQRFPPPVPHHTRPGGSNNGLGAIPIPAADASGRPYAVVRNGNLELSDGTPFRFASLNAPELLDGEEFEIEDTFRTLHGFGRRVTRCYTLKIHGTSPHLGDAGHIRGWDHQKGDWVYSEPDFIRMDKMLAAAAKYDVRVIIPLINQDFGSHNNNWVGNFVDLVRYRKNPSWSYAEATRVDFFTDRECIDSFKLILNYLLNRVNSITGVRYGSDSSVLFWETGNELQHNFRGNKPPPGEWTVEIARHIKTLAPQALVLDGSFAKCDGIQEAYGYEVLRAKEVDGLSYHYYGTGDTHRVKKDSALAKKFGKVFVAGEYGFLNSSNDYAMFLSHADREGCAGSLVWSLRPHSVKGGFKTHREDKENSAYHVPGWPSPQTPQGFSTPKDWDGKEHIVIQYIRHASYAINGEQVPTNHPLPNPPYIWASQQGQLSWRGSAWANSYEVWVGPEEDAKPPYWQCVGQGILDAVNEGHAVFSLPHNTQGAVAKMRGVSLEGIPGLFSNPIRV